MPRFIKNDSIRLIESGIDCYVMALFGLGMPSLNKKRVTISENAAEMGMLGASVELLSKACLIQAKGISAMFKNNDVKESVFKFGSEVIHEFKMGIKNNDPDFNYIISELSSVQVADVLSLLSKFNVLQASRANGLHAGIGCSKDVAVITANDVYDYIKLLSICKKLNAYLKNVPKPQSTIKDREAIIEDLSRRIVHSKDDDIKIDGLRSMYLVLPYIPEIEPSWLSVLERGKIAIPQKGDLSYLVRNLSDAHSIYLLKGRGGKEGLPVKIDNSDPNALPISVQNIKRELNTLVDKFNNDVLSANTRLKENRLDVPHEGFVLDLYLKGLENTDIIKTYKLTAQQTWCFVASSLMTQGTPRPFWFIVNFCDELQKLKSELLKVKDFSNAYYKKRISLILDFLDSIIEKKIYDIKKNKVMERFLWDIEKYYSNSLTHNTPNNSIFNPTYIRKQELSTKTKELLGNYLEGKIQVGNTIALILGQGNLSENEKSIVRTLLPMCFKYSDREGLISILRTSHLKGYHSIVRKNMYFTDFIKNGPNVNGINKDLF